MEVLETKARDGALSLGGGLALARGRGARRGQEGAEDGEAAGELHLGYRDQEQHG